MTGQLDTIARKVSSDLIGKFGATMTLTRVVEGAYDPATGTTTNSETDETVIGVIEAYKDFAFANGLAVSGDKKVMLAASDVAKPNLADKMTIQGIVYSILTIDETASGELNALY